MRWKQLFLPADNIDPKQARDMIQQSGPDELEVLDVRQPREYKRGHLPGAKLIPLPELENRLDELNPNTPVIAYCASGGRSRVAARTLADRGFERALNLKGGFKAWEGHAAVGSEDEGMHVFSGRESLEDILVAAYSLEQGLQDFYRLTSEKVHQQKARELFELLAGIEDRHKDRIFEQYRTAVDDPLDRDAFENRIVADFVEGGLTTREYFQRFQLDMESRTDILDMAMTIEAQALDLYRRAEDRFNDRELSAFFLELCGEEREHLSRLSQLMEDIADDGA